MTNEERDLIEKRIQKMKRLLIEEQSREGPSLLVVGRLQGNIGALEWVAREIKTPCQCGSKYLDVTECPRCTPVRKDGRCNRCGTVGDHYCPADVARS